MARRNDMRRVAAAANSDQHRRNGENERAGGIAGNGKTAASGGGAAAAQRRGVKSVKAASETARGALAASLLAAYRECGVAQQASRCVMRGASALARHHRVMARAACAGMATWRKAKMAAAINGGRRRQAGVGGDQASGDLGGKTAAACGISMAAPHCAGHSGVALARVMA